MSVDTHGLEVLRRSAEEITLGNTQELRIRTSTEPNSSLVSTDNSSSSILNNGQTYTGTWENTNGFATVAFSLKTDQAGSLYADFSTDGVNADSTLTYTVAADTNEVHRLTITKQYFRLRFTNNSGSNQTYFRLQSILGNHPLLTSSLSSTITSDADTIVTRSILYGEQDSGEFAAVPVTGEGHLEMALHEPLLPFGSIHVENMRPVFQCDPVYQINSQLCVATTSGTGSATVSDSNFVCSTGTTIYSQASIQSRKRLRYRPGQGVIARFTGLFTSPVASSYQVVGVGHAEDGFYFGYVGTSFGILYVNRGVRETRTLTITTASSTNESMTVQLNGVNYTVAVTNSANIQRTVWEISQGTYAGWKAEPLGATIRFISDSVGAKSGAYSITAATALGSFAQTKAGAASNDTFVAKSAWNGDKLDGTGHSGVTMDLTKYNVFQIGIQYLGAGAIVFKVETAPSSSNNPTWTTVHTLRLPNTLTTSSLGNPSFPFTMAAYSAGSTTDLTMKCASFAGFIEGDRLLHGPRFSYFNQLTTVGASNYQAFFTIMNARTYSGRSNQSVINIISISGALKHTSPCIFYLIKNGSLAGNPSFSSYATNSSSLYDSTATTVTISTNDQVLWTGHLGDTGELDHHFNGGGSEEITLQPGEWLTLAAKAVTGTPSYVTGSVNTREDQ